MSKFDSDETMNVIKEERERRKKGKSVYRCVEMVFIIVRDANKQIMYIV